MESPIYRSAVVALVFLVLLAEPSEARRRGADARSNDSGVDVVIEVDEGGQPRSKSGGSASDCDWSIEPYAYTGIDPPRRFGEPPSPEHRLYLIFCNGEYVSTEWLGPRPDGEASGSALAQRVLRHVLVDAASIGVRPEARGVTGIPSLFWVEGYRGERIRESVSELGVTVDVEVTLDRVTWDFGDGTPAVSGSLGQPWPEQSDVRHTYRDRGEKVVTVTLVLPARFRVDGGPWQDLAPITRVATIPYAVDEVQAVRDR